MKSFCKNGCCFVLTREYRHMVQQYSRVKKEKAGVFLYDPKTNKILLVQSRGTKWGPPKGTMEIIDKTVVDCAIREAEEETGLNINPDDFIAECRIDRATYFLLHRNECDIALPEELGNDASGIGWVSPNCIQTLNLDLNSHCKKLLTRFVRPV